MPLRFIGSKESLPPCYSVDSLDKNTRPQNFNTYQFLRQSGPGGNGAIIYSDPCASKEEKERKYYLKTNFTGKRRNDKVLYFSESEYDAVVQKYQKELDSGELKITGPIEISEFPSKGEAYTVMAFRNLGLSTQRKEIQYLGSNTSKASLTDMTIIANVLDIDTSDTKNPFKILPKIIIPFEIWGKTPGGVASKDFQKFQEYRESQWGQLSALQYKRLYSSQATAEALRRIITSDLDSSGSYLFKRAIKDTLGFYLFNKVKVSVMEIESSKVPFPAHNFISKILNKYLIFFNEHGDSDKCVARELIEKFNIPYTQLDLTSANKLFDDFVNQYENVLANGLNHIEALIQRGQVDHIKLLNGLNNKKRKISEIIVEKAINGENYTNLMRELHATNVSISPLISDDSISEMRNDVASTTLSPELDRIITTSHNVDTYQEKCQIYHKVLLKFAHGLQELKHTGVLPFIQSLPEVNEITNGLSELESVLNNPSATVEELANIIDSMYFIVNNNLPNINSVITEAYMRHARATNPESLSKASVKQALGRFFNDATVRNFAKQEMIPSSSVPTPEFALPNIPVAKPQLPKPQVPAITNQSIDLTVPPQESSPMPSISEPLQVTEEQPIEVKQERLIRRKRRRRPGLLRKFRKKH